MSKKKVRVVRKKGFKPRKDGVKKYRCKACNAVHWYVPLDGCKRCKHRTMERVE